VRFNPGIFGLTGRRTRAGSGPPAFSPLTVPGLVLWLDGSRSSSITTVSGLVTTWADLSGSGNDAGQSTLENRPSVRSASIGGLNTLGFGTTATAGAAYLGFAGVPLAGASAATLLLVGSNDTEAGALAAPVEFWGSSTQGNHQPYSGTIYSDFASTTRRAFGFDAGALMVPGLYQLVSAGGYWSFSLGSSLLLSDSSNTVGLGGSPTLGGTPSFSPWPGQIAEVLVFSRVLMTPEFASCRAYLAGKWGL
jgi:hypothetical protein